MKEGQMDKNMENDMEAQDLFRGVNKELKEDIGLEK